jgi:CRP/FNR family cyclic AMP-dependent transcriptional regulator
MAIDATIYGYVVREELYQPNAPIIVEGKRGAWIYVVLEGKVKVKKQTQHGTVTVDTLEEGAIVGEMALLSDTNRERTASVIAEGPVKVGLLDKDRLEREYERLSPQLKGLIRTLVLRLKETTEKTSLLAAGLKERTRSTGAPYGPAEKHEKVRN